MLDYGFGPAEIEDTAGRYTEEEFEQLMRSLKRKAPPDAPPKRTGVLTYAAAYDVAAAVLFTMPPLLDEMDNKLAERRLSQLAKRTEVQGVARRLGGAGWKGPPAKRKAAERRTEEQVSAYRAEHRSRTGYGRGRPKKEDERREYPPKRPRGRPRSDQ